MDRSVHCSFDVHSCKLRLEFFTRGLPKVVVLDNGTALTSDEFIEFIQQNGVRHITTAPYHPFSNGLAQWAVQTVKEGFGVHLN